jgi:SAM-dependent methyltransferase
MDQPNCSVCGRPLEKLLYTSSGGQSLTSLCRIYPGETRVFVCEGCGHLQTNAMANVDFYYDSEYDILVDSEEEDQIYEICDGKVTYRTERQVQVLLEKLQLQAHVDLLDYGCAKSSTIRTLCSMVHGVVPHVFDVSARYVPFWEKFVSPGNWAVNTTQAGWKSHFDVVTSFFSLEHIPAVTRSVREIAGLLKPGGTFYCVVPNVFSNSADFIVVDHCNHFTPSSLARLLTDAGLQLREIDSDAHRGAFVVTAVRSLEGNIAEVSSSLLEIERTCRELSTVADFWSNASARVRAYEAALNDGVRVAVYGAGFYGAFISASLTWSERIDCYLDQNPFLQGREFNACPVLPPGDLPDEVRVVLVGLNPAHARTIIADIPALSRRKLDYFYL